jgi:hypothetical protein
MGAARRALGEDVADLPDVRVHGFARGLWDG